MQPRLRSSTLLLGGLGEWAAAKAYTEIVRYMCGWVCTKSPENAALV